jgi:hypothetical protein
VARRSKVDSDGNSSQEIKSLADKWGGSPSTSSGAQWAWGNVDGNLMYSLAEAVGSRRGAVMYGVDRQGVGGTLSVWLSGEKVVNKWYRPDLGGYGQINEDIEVLLADIQALPERA